MSKVKNDAVELIEKYLVEYVDTTTKTHNAIHFLTWLALEGYIIVPIEGELH
jgi:hypothetical protein